MCFYLFGNTSVQPRKLCFSGFRPEFFQVPWGCPKPKWPLNPVFRNFPPLGVRSVKTESLKKLHNCGDKLLGRPHFPPKSASSTGKLRCSVFRPEFLLVPRAVLGQNGPKSQYFAISCPWGLVGRNGRRKKAAQFWGETVGAAGFPPKKCP